MGIRSGQGAIKAWVEDGKEKEEVKISGLYNIMMLVCIYMAQVGIAQMHFALMLQLMADVNVYPDDGPKYNHPRYFWACMFAISEVLLRRLISDIKFTELYSYAIIMDSSTDVGDEDHDEDHEAIAQKAREAAGIDPPTGPGPKKGSKRKPKS
jgi:hypothetical protein